MEEKFTVGLIVSNHFGVLNRVAGMYGKRCYNINSLSVGETEDQRFSRMTIVSTGDEYIKEQVVKQLRKLHDVKMVALLDEDNSISVEHMLVKLNTDGYKNAEIVDFVNGFSGKVIDYGNDFLTVEITGETDKIERFLEGVRKFGILELSRSGLIAMAHGTKEMLSIKELM
jgi:acetolactate synthase-1/3 small subunit